MFEPDGPPSPPREPAPGHVIVLTMAGRHGRPHVAGVFPDVASMRRFTGRMGGMFYTRHDAPISPRSR